MVACVLYVVCPPWAQKCTSGATRWTGTLLLTLSLPVHRFFAQDPLSLQRTRKTIELFIVGTWKTISFPCLPQNENHLCPVRQYYTLADKMILTVFSNLHVSICWNFVDELALLAQGYLNRGPAD